MSKHPFRSASLTFTLSALIALGAARAPRADEAAPKPAPEIARIVALAGTWEGSGTVSMPGRSAPATVRHESHVIAGGFGLQTHETIDSALMGHYEAEDLFGQDPGTGRTHLYTVDNAADVHDHAGTWTDEHTLHLRHTGTVDGKRYVEDLTLALRGTDQYALRLNATLAGKRCEWGEIVMHRVQMSNR